MKITFKISRELRIGFFAVLILTSLFFLINYLKGRDLFGKTKYYYAIYDNVEGLTTTGPVFIRGLRVGYVEKIYFKQVTEQFVVTMSVKSNYRIPENSVAEIYSSDLLGSKSIRINLGDSKTYLNDNDTLGSFVETPLINVLKEQLVPLRDKVENLVESMNKAFVNINDVLDEKTKKDLAQSISGLNASIANIESISGNLDSKKPQINHIINNIDSISSSLKSNTNDINRGVRNIADISDSLKAADLKGTIASLNSLLKKIEDPNGTVGKLITTDTLHTKINNLIQELDILVKNINQNPKKYIKVTVF